ncbi:hypothetical protein HYV81_03825 [Candidatus Woesearchaeota archaeon]|nr:hypothetical protein [Candidatus Woesearchaeota archaeon]
MPRAQLKMAETLGVIFVFLILVIFGFMFYAKFQRATFKTVLQEEQEKRSVEVAQRAFSLPELQCAANNIMIDNCIDILKLEALSRMLQADSALQLIYYDSFESSRIVVKQLYPARQEWKLYERTTNSSGSLFTPLPVSLYDPVAKRYNMGVVEVTYYP